MKVIAILLALINSLAAGLIIAASVPGIEALRPVAAVVNALKVAISLAVIAVGVVTWMAACRRMHPAPIFVAGLFLVSLGTGAAVWTLHVALSGGAIRDHMLLYGGSLTMQGASALWSLLTGRRGATSI